MLLPDSQIPEQWTVVNTPPGIRRMVRRILRKAPGPVEICYEAGVCGFALQRRIQAHGAVCKVIAPSLVPVAPGQRIKTDRRDARKLAAYLRAGILTEVRPPDEEAESARDLVRRGEAAQADLLRSQHRLLKFLLRRAMHYRDGSHWTQKHFRWLGGLRFERARDTAIFNGYLAEVHHRRDQVAAVTDAIVAMAGESPYVEPVGWLRCFRGIDVLTAMTVVTELYSIERFVSPRQLMSYLGLVPWEASSGECEHKGGITKTGNRRVRRVLVQAAWNQCRRVGLSPALKARRAGQPAWAIQLADHAMRRLHRKYWHLINRGKLPKVAVVAVARELVGFIWAALYLKDQAPVYCIRRQARRDGTAHQRSAPAPRQTAAEFLGLAQPARR